MSFTNAVFLGLGKICLLRWEASGRTVPQHGPKTVGLRSRLNTSTSPFHTPKKEHCHSLSHNSFYVLSSIMSTLNPITTRICACLPPILYHSENPRCTSSGWKTHYLMDPSEKQAKTVRNNFHTRQIRPIKHCISGLTTLL